MIAQDAGSVVTGVTERVCSSGFGGFVRGDVLLEQQRAIRRTVRAVGTGAACFVVGVGSVAVTAIDDA